MSRVPSASNAPAAPVVFPPLLKPGQVVVMSLPQLHAYMKHHNLEPLAWRNNVLVLQKVIERPALLAEVEKEKELA